MPMGVDPVLRKPEPPWGMLSCALLVSDLRASNLSTAIFGFARLHPTRICERIFRQEEGGMMNVKNAALLALTGTSLLTLVLLVHLVLDGWGFFNGVVAVMRLGASLIRTFAAASLAVFFWTFQRARA